MAGGACYLAHHVVARPGDLDMHLEVLRAFNCKVAWEVDQIECLRGMGVTNRLTLSPPKPWVSVVALPEAQIKHEQLSGLIKPA